MITIRSWRNAFCVQIFCYRRISSTSSRTSAGPTVADRTMILIHPILKYYKPVEGQRSLQNYYLQEAVGLAKTLGWDVPYEETCRIRRMDPKLFLGRGKVHDLKGIVKHTNATCVFVNTPFLTALQQRALADALDVEFVKDRMTVILEIFASRARTNEAKLQIELAKHRYALSHVVKGFDAGFDQQRGGFGFMSGGGEKALEVRRRVLRNEIKAIEAKLEAVKRQRAERNKHRNKPTVSLLGYTNVGKSSLLNRLSQSEAVTVQDRVFETLDTTTRRLYLPSVNDICLISDTVGFISNLPTQLVAAFRSTLEEVLSADLLLHVRDASTIGTELFEAQRISVDQVLREIATPQHLEGNVIEVWNKIDLVQGDEQCSEYNRLLQERRSGGSKLLTAAAVPISVHTKEGIKELIQVIEKELQAKAYFNSSTGSEVHT